MNKQGKQSCWQLQKAFVDVVIKVTLFLGMQVSHTDSHLDLTIVVDGNGTGKMRTALNFVM
jgi:hypothetical protein